MAQKYFGIAVTSLLRAQPFTSIFANYLRDLVEAAIDRRWKAYIFCPQDVLKQKNIVWGWTRIHGEWRKDFFSLPDVCLIKTTYLSPNDRKIISWLKTKNTRFINGIQIEDIIFDRWRIIQIILSHATLASKIPESNLMENYWQLPELEQRSSIIFSRYRRSSETIGFLTPHQKGFKLKISHRATNKTLLFQSKINLAKQIRNTWQEAIMQPALKVLSIEGYPILIRSVWQKRVDWQQTFAALRVSAKKNQFHFVTVSLANKIYPLLWHYFGARRDSIIYQLENSARLVAELMEARAGSVGELAIDFLIDKQANIWIHDLSTYTGTTSLAKLAPEVKKLYLNNTLDLADKLYFIHY